jgi:fructokinase
MTLVDEARQQQLIDQLQGHLVHSRRASGGSAANTTIAVSQFGGRTFYSCRVADDDNGRFYLDDLRQAGVDSRTDNLGNGTTGKCLVLITPDAERSMNTYLGISETLSSDDLSAEAIIASQYLYIEGYLVTSPSGRAAAIRAREIAEKNGTKTALSFSDPGIVAHFRDGLAEMVGDRLDLVFCNQDEAFAWAGTDDMEAAITAMRKIAKTFAITRGAEGSLICDGSRILEIEPFKVKAVDTNGAGDMFAGAFLYGITQGHGFAAAGRLASLAAATVVSEFGPRLPAERHAQLLDQLQLG